MSSYDEPILVFFPLKKYDFVSKKNEIEVKIKEESPNSGRPKNEEQKTETSEKEKSKTKSDIVRDYLEAEERESEKRESESLIPFEKFNIKLAFCQNGFTFKMGEKEDAQGFSYLKISAEIPVGKDAPPDAFTVRCVVKVNHLMNDKEKIADINLTTGKPVKILRKFMSADDIEKYSNLNSSIEPTLELTLKISLIENEVPLPLLQELRLDSNFIKTERTYELREFDGNEPTEDDVRKVMKLLGHIYSTKDGLLKMFVDEFKIVKNPEEKWLLKHSCNFNFETGKFNSNDLASENLKINVEYGVNFKAFREAAKMEFELIKNANLNCPSYEKRHYVYFYLDPFKADNFPIKAHPLIRDILLQYIRNSQPFNLLQLLNEEILKMMITFSDAIFYTGIGQGNRSLAHFDYARYPDKKAYMETNKWNKLSINEIWDNSEMGKGPILLHLIDEISEEEAMFREAFLMNTIGFKQLNNVGRETVKLDLVSKLNSEDNVNAVRCLWYSFMFKAFFKFILEGEVQVLKEKENLPENEQE